MSDDVWAPAIEEERRLAEAQKKMREDAIRAAFTKEGDNDGWMWTSIDQYAPDGNVIAQIRFLICPLCMAVIVMPPDEVDVDINPHLDWPQRHVEWHVSGQA